MKRNRVAIIVLIIAGLLILYYSVLYGTAVGGTHHHDAKPRQLVTAACFVSADSATYELRLTNVGTVPDRITGFIVALYSNGIQNGSDTEPGSGYVNGTAALSMDDWIMPGQTATYDVQPDNWSGGSDCELIVP